jgi:hypothetical protein
MHVSCSHCGKVSYSSPATTKRRYVEEWQRERQSVTERQFAKAGQNVGQCRELAK